MAKKMVKRVAAKPARPSKPIGKSPKSVSSSAAKPSAKASAKLPAKPTPKPAIAKVAPKVAAKPVVKSTAKSTTKSAAKPIAKPIAKPAAKGSAKPSAKGEAKADGKVDPKLAKVDPKTLKKLDAAKPANGKLDKHAGKPGKAEPVVVARPANARPMLIQGPIAARPTGKKGSQIVLKPITPAPKPVKKRPDPIEPQFVVVERPVAAVATSERASKNKAGLSQKELDGFRDLLLARRRELLGDMNSMEREALRESNANLSNLPVHMADQGTDAYEQEFTLGLVEKDRALLRELNDALAKIQNGTYGICEGTGQPISKPRLEAQPWARHSIEYARVLEKRKMAFRR